MNIAIGHGKNTIVSIEDYDFLNGYKWHGTVRKPSTKVYVYTKIKGRDLAMHRLVIMKCLKEEVIKNRSGNVNKDSEFNKYLDEFFHDYKTIEDTDLITYFWNNYPKKRVVDHRDGNSLNNQRDNLRISTFSVNSQNRVVEKTVKSTSIYRGVSFNKNKWYAMWGKVQLGSFDNELEAGIRYDTYIFLLQGRDSVNNGLVKYDDIKDININDLLPKKKVKVRDLPFNIYLTKSGNYNYQIIINKKRYSETFETLDQTVKALETLKIEQKKLDGEIPITRNNEGIAYLVPPTRPELQILVDDDKWHKLNTSWYITKGEYAANNKGPMHRQIFTINGPIKEGNVIDHKNGNRLDNRIDNLRSVDETHNNQNRVKKEGCASKYIGVSRKRSGWQMEIRKNNIRKRLYFNIEKEKEAAMCYNILALLYYGPDARLNTFDD